MICELTRDGCEYVIKHMRDTDRRTILGLRFTDDIGEFIESRWTNRGTAWQAERDGEIRMIGGICLSPIPGGVIFWLIGCDRWRSVMIEVTRFVKRVLIQKLLDDGFHRIEISVLAADLRAIAYAQRLGFRYEGTMREIGRYREDYFNMAIVNEV